MAVTLTDHRIIVNEADAITGWTGTTTLFTTDPTPIEAGGELGATVGAAIFDSYVAYSDDLSNAVIYCWVFSRLALGNTTDVNGGLMVSVGEATNLGAWKVAGADLAAFRHDAGPTGWQCPALDTTSLPASPLSRAGSAASVNFSAVTRVGTTVNSLVAAPGMNPTYLVDIIRVLDISDTAFSNCAISVIGGTSGDPGTFAQIAAADRSIGNQQAHGILRELAAGSYGCQGPLRFGNAAGIDDSWFDDTNAVLVFESRGFRTTLYKIFITDNGTGTTTFKLTNCALIAPPGVGASFDSLTDTDVTAVTVTGTRIDGFTGGVGIGGGAGQVFTNCTFSNGGAVSVTSQSVNLTNSSVLLSTVAANASALVWNIDIDPDGKLDNMTFSKGTNAHHAIEFGAALTLPKTIYLRGIDFSGFSATAGGTTGDETFYIKDTTGTLTINLIGCTGNFGYRTDGATVILVEDPVTATVNVKNINDENILEARVFVKAATGGPFPFDVTVSSIVNSGTTATVTHTLAHAMATGDKVVISGASLDANNGTFTITVTGTNTYTYTMGSTPGSSPTGTIKCTFVVLSGLTDASGNITMNRVFSSAQPVTGWARKATGATLYKQSAIGGSVSATTGFSANIILLSDD